MPLFSHITLSQEQTLNEYHDKNLVTKKWSIADLTQLPRNGRARTGHGGGALAYLNHELGTVVFAGLI